MKNKIVSKNLSKFYDSLLYANNMKKCRIKIAMAKHMTKIKTNEATKRSRRIAALLSKVNLF